MITCPRCDANWIRGTAGPRTGQPLMFLRDGVWRGPEATEAQKAALANMRPDAA